MLSVQEIKTFIENDAASIKKKLARTGQRYYEAEHDIKDYRIFFINKNGDFEEDKLKSNIKISHPFFTELVDQEVQYILSTPDGFVRSDDPDLQEQLDAYFNDNEDFMAELYEVITGCVAKGFEYAYAYKNADDRIAFKCADSLGVVEVKAKETDDGCEYVIFWYVDRIGKDNKFIKKIQVWDSAQTYFYVQEDDGKILKDDSEKLNPRPHTVWTEGDDGKIYYEDFGMIPFFRLDNCRKQFSGLKPIKALIDDYDLMSCGLSNNIQDTNEALYVIKGFDGDDPDEMLLNVKAKKHVGVSEDGGVDIKTVDIPYQARQAKLDLDRECIYKFGFGLDTSNLKDTSATTNIAIKSAYSLLDLKAKKLEIRLKQFMRKLLKLVLAEINEVNGTDYQQKDVYFAIEPEVPTNAMENAQIELTEAQRRQTEINTLLGLATKLDNETLMQQICEQLDLEYNDLKDKLPPPEEVNDPYAAEVTLEAMTPTEPEDGDVIG
jgi:SPP1 family phage portal protein